MSETELYQRLVENRLRGRTRWAGAALALGVLIPYEVIDEQPQFLWQLFGELPPSGVIAGLSPAAAGMVILLARWRCARAVSLAIATLAALAGMALLQKLGADASAWGLLPLPTSLSARAGTAMAAMALTAAGAQLAHRAPTRRAAAVLLWGAVVCAAIFYLWPGRGEAPGLTIYNGLAALDDMPGLRFQIGALTLALVASWPAIIALAGLLHLRWPPRRSVPVLSMLAPFGFPLVLTMLVFSWYLRTSPGSAMFAALGAAVEITAVLALSSAAFETLGQHTERSSELPALPRGWAPWKSAATALGLLALVLAAQFQLSRPPKKGVRWELGAPSEPGDRLFGELVVGWSDARWLWDRRVRENSSASELLEVKARGRRMVEASNEVSPVVGTAMEALARAGWDLDVSSRAWYRLVDDVNVACQTEGLPYYLDPRVAITKEKDGIRRHLLVDSYRVVRVRRFDVGGDEHATLHVRAFGTRRGGHALGLLGFSRDVQPFALVVLDSTDAHAAELFTGDGEPTCGLTFELASHAALRRCGQVLAPLLKDQQALRRSVEDVVERHELQHQIDGPLLTLARPVLEKMAGYVDEAKERVNRELSAYVAQMTAEAPHVGLVIPLRFVLLSDRGTYHHAAVLMLEALGGRTIRDAAGEVDGGEAAAVFDELAALEAEALSARAARAWEDLFGDELPPVRRLEEQTIADRTPASGEAEP